VTRALAVAAALLSVTLVTGCSGDEDPGISLAAATRGDVAEVVEAPGTVTARASASVTSPADGQVAQLGVTDGGRVRAGQVLLQIDSPAAQEQLRQAESADREAAGAGSVRLPGVNLSAQQRQADRAAARGFAEARKAAAAIADPTAKAQALTAVASAEAQYSAAQAQARDAVRRVNAGLGSVAEALGSLAQAQRVQTRAAVAVARRTVAALVVRAPITGTVSFAGGSRSGGGGDLSGALSQLPESVRGQASSALGAGGSTGAVSGTLAVGAPVTSGAALLTVTDVSTVGVSVEVDETDVLLVRPGVAADVELDAVPGARYAARVASVDVAPTASGRGGVSYVVRLTLGAGTEADGTLAPRPRPGMSAVADLRVRTARGVVAAPAAAVFRDGTRDAVWVARADGTATKRPVRLGAEGEDTVEVREGLRAGDRVVVRGADRVTEGQRLP
jgi:multidrug efflux pump subunit AcrA (membrane-fusion protein)